MDIAKTKAAINAFQNSFDKLRPFTTMLQSATELWNALAQFNPDEFQKLVDQREAVQGQLNDVTAKRDQIRGQIEGLQDEYTRKRGKLEEDFKAKQKELEAEHAQNVHDIQNEIANLRAQADKLRDENAHMIADAKAQHDKVQAQIAALRSTFEQANQALHG